LYNAFMPVPILTTKLYIPPPRPNAVQRPRLIDRLNAGLRAGCKLALISAPAGFGKTTLVSEWIAALTPSPSPLGRGEGVRVAWLSLDENDSDLTRFLTYFVATMQTIAPQFGEGLLAALQSAQPPTDTLLTSLLNELVTLPDRFTLVLDDYHMLDCKPIDEALTFLLDHLPLHMQLVITTREDPQLPLARLRARGQLIELRAADLRFTPDEAAEFLNHAMGLSLSPENIAALESRTEGWIAGLQLAALSMQGRSDTTSFIESFSGSHHFVLDYLLAEVLQQQAADVQTFLLRTSILDRLCGSLCEAVLLTPAGSGQLMLEYLEHANLFSVPLDNERRWYRYHRLFADLLRQRLQQIAPDSADYHRRASRWYGDNSFMAEAFQHALAARDFDRAADVAQQAWPIMEGTFQTAAWLSWIKQLPENVIRARPVLCVQIGRAFSDAGEPEPSERYLQEAECGLAGTADRAEFRPLPGNIALIRAYNAQVQGNVAETVKYAELAQQLIAEDDVFQRAQAAITLEFTHWASGNLTAAQRALVEWMKAMGEIGNEIFVIASAFAVADIQIAQGRLREALRTYEQAVQAAAEAGPEAQAITAHHQLGMALLYHELNNAEACAAHWQQAAELGQRTTLVDWSYRWHVAQAHIKQAEGDYDAALELLDEAQRVYVKNPVPDVRPIAALKAQIYLRQGRWTKAQEWAHERGLLPTDAIDYLREFEYLTLARVLMAEGAHRSAVELLERLRVAAAAQDRAGNVIEILIAQALAQQAQGDTSAAYSALDLALTLAEPEGYVRVFVNEGEEMQVLIAECRVLLEKQRDREGQKLIEYADKLLAAFPRPVVPQSTTPALHQAQRGASVRNQPSEIVDSLSPRELEVLRLIEQGLSNQEIADRLYLAVSTVKGYTRTIFDKLQVQRRTEAVARARELSLL
jgi:LuxR family transcriptional regulator, maltose regulon positive regulatory protein